MSYDNHYNISNLRIVDASGEEITKRFEYDYSNHIVLRVCEKNGTTGTAD